MTKPVLITRPTEDATRLASGVAYLGATPILCPLMTIRFLDGDLDLDNVQGLLFTSANGVRAYARLTENRDLPVFTVGEATAREARTCGFETVDAAAGDVDALARLVIERCKAGDGDFLHVAGTHRAGDLSGLLAAAGFVTRRAVLYAADQIDNIPDTAADILKEDRPSVVLLYSPRTAALFGALVEKAGLTDHLSSATALCLSQAVAEKISSFQWAKVVVAEKPEQDNLLGQLERILAEDMADEKDQHAQEQEEHLTDAVDAEALIDAFGGIRPMAHKLDVAVSTVQGWKLRNHIPPARLDDIEKAASENDIDLTEIIKKTSEGEDQTEPVETTKATADTSAPKEADEPSTQGTDEPAVATTPPPAIVTKRSGNKVAWAALIASLAVGSAMVLQPYWGDAVDQRLQPVLQKFAPKLVAMKSTDADMPMAASQQDLDILRRQMDGLASAISALEVTNSDSAAGEDQAGTEGDLTTLRDQVTALQDRLDQIASANGPAVDLSAVEARIGQLEAARENTVSELTANNEALQKALDAANLEAGTLAARVSELSSRLQAVETTTESIAQQPGSRNQKEIALVVAAGQLEVLALNGHNYEDALTTFQALATDMPSLDASIDDLSMSASGVATRTRLHRDFQSLAAKIDKPIKDATEADWVDATLANISGLVSIRRTGTAPDLPPMSRAEAALAQDDLVGAIEALAPLSADRPDVADWLDDARHRLAVEQSITRIRDETTKRLALASVTPDSTLARAASDASNSDTTGNDEADQ